MKENEGTGENAAEETIAEGRAQSGRRVVREMVGLLQASIFLKGRCLCNGCPFFCQVEKNYVESDISKAYREKDDRMAFLLLFTYLFLSKRLCVPF